MTMREAQTEMILDRLPDMEHMPGRVELPYEVLCIVGYLVEFAKGKENAARSSDIGRYLSFPGKDPGRHVRKLISLYLADLPCIVCGTPGDGFFVSTEAEDMDHYEQNLHALLKASAVRIKAFRQLTKRMGYERTGTGQCTHYRKRQRP